jgi:hypothetical protein
MRFAYLIIGAVFALYFVILFIGWIIEQL